MSDEVIKSPDGETHWLTTWDHYVAWAGAPALYHPAEHVTVYDLDKSQARHVVDAPHGEDILWVHGARDTLTYETIRLAKDDSTKSDWTIHVLDLGSGRTRVVDRADTSASRDITPSLALDYPYLLWNRATTGHLDDLWSLNLATGKRTRLVSRTFVSQVQAAGASAYFVGCKSASCDGYRVPLAGGLPRKVTHSANVGQATFGQEGAAYNEPSTGDPKGVYYQSYSAASPLRLDPGYGLNMAVGDGFVAWSAELGDSVVVRSTAPGAAPALTVAHSKSPVARISAVRDRLVFVEWTLDAQRRPTGERIHVMTVSPG